MLEKQATRFKRAAALMAFLICFVSGCAHDVAREQSSGFAPFLGRCFVLPRGAFLRSYFGNGWFLYPPGYDYFQSSVQAYEIDRGRTTERGLRVLEPQTNIKIVQLIDEPLNSSSRYHPYALVLSGQFKGMRAEIGSILKSEGRKGAPRVWSVDRANLADCIETNHAPKASR
jgi:hypothetical protein